MKKYLTVNHIGSLASIIAFLFFLYFQFIKKDDKEISLKIYQISLLTQKSTGYENLRAIYYFNDSLVQNLWVINFAISNTGDKSVIGSGDRKDLIDNSLTLKLNNDFKIIKLDSVNSNFPYKIESNGKNIQLRFKQIKPNETIELKLYIINEKSNNVTPTLTFDERGLIEVNTKFLDKNDSEVKKYLMDYFSKETQIVLKWLAYVLLLGITFLAQFLLTKTLTEKNVNGWLIAMFSIISTSIFVLIMLQFRL